MKGIQWKQRLPGYIATGLFTLTTGLWVFWGTAEMYYEGWGNPFPMPLAYLIPGTAFLLATALVLTWPRIGGWILVAGGTLFSMAVLRMQIQRAGGFHFWAFMSYVPVTVLIVIVGVLFLLEGRSRRRRREAGQPPHPRWWLRNLHYVVGLGAPLVTLVVVSAVQLPGILARIDDGDRGARLIEGNGVTLVWAPAGPGWNWKQPWGGYPAWDSLALYGRPPIGIERKLPDMDTHATQEDMRTVGLCRYLSEDGLTLMDEPQNVWRMPTTDEYVRSLVKRGENAGCSWHGEGGKVSCRVRPDKETPLWAPDQEPIYMWTGEESAGGDAWYVSYNGYVWDQPKNWGNPRHGYRCVREGP
jgi:hypothetical protein